MTPSQKKRETSGVSALSDPTGSGTGQDGLSPHLVSAVASGDRRASLEALRDHLAAALVDVDARYKAPLAKQLADTMRELDGIRDVKVVSPLDELVSKRAARIAAS